MSLLSVLEAPLAAAENEAKTVAGAIVYDAEKFWDGLEPELATDAKNAFGVIRAGFTDASGTFLPTLYTAAKGLISSVLSTAVAAGVSGGNPVTTVLTFIESNAPALLAQVGQAALTSLIGAVASTMPQLNAIGTTVMTQVETATKAAAQGVAAAVKA